MKLLDASLKSQACLGTMLCLHGTRLKLEAFDAKIIIEFCPLFQVSSTRIDAQSLRDKKKKRENVTFLNYVVKSTCFLSLKTNL